MRILAVLHSSEIGGTEVCYGRLLEVLAARSDVEILGMYPQGPMVETWAKLAPWTPYRAGALPLRFVRRDFAQWVRSGIRRSGEIAATIESWKPDVVLSLTSVLTAPAGVAHRLNVPAVSYVREYVEPPLVRELLWRRLAHRSDILIAISSQLLNDLSPYARGRVRFVRDGVPLPSLPGSPSSPPTVAFFGGYEPVKGGDLFIDAVPDVHAAAPEAGFSFYGECWPHQRGFCDRVRRRADELGIPVDFVETRGFAKHEATASLVVMPSRQEGLGLVGLESMSYGVPVVAADVGGLRDVVVDGVTGLLVPPEDPVSLGNALIRLLKDGPLRERMGAAARERVQEHFSVQSAVDGLLDVLHEVLERRARAR